MSHHPHTLDEVIGARRRSAEEIAGELAKSPVFHAALDRAIAQSDQNAGGSRHFGRSVRLALAYELVEGRLEE
jgi:hypothetical protein